MRTVIPHINGRSLIDLAREVETPSAAQEGKPELAGSYDGLMADERIAWPSAHFLGEPVLSWFGDGDTVLLGCECGEWGCWPLTTQVTADDELILWSRFRQGHRNWDYSRLGPFLFSREQYERALMATAIPR